MIYSKLSNILNDINSILFPWLCFGCNARLYRGEQILCAFCRNQLPLTEYSLNEENAVDRIFYGRTDIKNAISLLYYTEKGIVKNLIHSLKYRNRQEIGSFLGDWLGTQLAQEINSGAIDYVIPVPLHPKKQKKRGYNQVTFFGEQIAAHLDAKYLPNILIKKINTRSQTKKERENRWQDPSVLYDISEPAVLRRKNVLLVDDIITTGATIEACSEAIHSVEGVNISIASMAYVA